MGLKLCQGRHYPPFFPYNLWFVAEYFNVSAIAKADYMAVL